ncbi:Hypothetical protein NTJ_04147 [Nesidiocoris tenuis]|uniref:Kazal-like domain-containing protein n=1 Tax=Nesidiocoris tenuis TaxID=355587 RepID=A0ABN7AJ05_9HEMI|nr:Hypothetical protein NTJ_04147 [Nesidiocoris tenuis]
MNMYAYFFFILGLLIASADSRILSSDAAEEPTVASNPVSSHRRFIRQFNVNPSQRTTTTTVAPVPGVVYLLNNCSCQSTTQYNPVCGTDGVTYLNRQKLECAAACGTNVKLRRFGNCSQIKLTTVGARQQVNT